MFEILEIPGQGAHATVCVARQLHDDSVVCLKVLQKAYRPDSEPAMRVRDEARLLERLDHPNIVALEKRLEIAGRQVLVMEWVKGDPLQRVVRKNGAFPGPIALRVVQCVADAALYAYQLPEADGQPLKLVHRDLSLSNILLSVRGEVKVLDYGMARAQFEERESDTLITLRGSAGYTAPEGLTTSEDSLDVYSLGICLLFLLTGHMPVFSKQKLSHDLRVSEVLDWLKENRPELDQKPLSKLVRGMCAYIAEDRLSMAEVVQQLGDMQIEADLEAFADRLVRPAHNDRSRLPAAEHPAYDELAFLEGGRMSGGDNRLRKLLRKKRWYEREKEIKWMLVRNPDWTGKPLVEYLERARRPWWQLWIPEPPRDGVMAALRLLSHRRDADVKKVCKRLRKHRDPKIAALASSLC